MDLDQTEELPRVCHSYPSIHLDDPISRRSELNVVEAEIMPEKKGGARADTRIANAHAAVHARSGNTPTEAHLHVDKQPQKSSRSERESRMVSWIFSL